MVMWKPMLTTYSEDAPIGDQWRYEVKYDGFAVVWNGKQVELPYGPEMEKN